MSSHSATVGRHNGRTAIFVDEQPIPGIGYLGSARHDASVLREAVETGIRIVLVHGGGAWSAPGQWNFAAYVRDLERAAALAPDVWLIPRLGLDAPDWWVRAHPGECIRHADSSGPEPHASLGSEMWLTDTSAYLAAAVRAIETSPVGPRILGYSLMCGHGGEWVYPGAGAGRVGDFSTPALRYFRNWLRRKHGDQDWIRTAGIPTVKERAGTLPSLLREPLSDRPAIDFDVAFSEMGADAVLRLARTIKTLTGNRRLVGVFYGYLLWQTGLVNAAASNGHLALRLLLDSPDIDFVTAFPSYDVREHGSAAPILVPVESIQAAGKLLFNECDNRTHLTKMDVPERFLRVRESRDPANGPQLWQGMFNILPLESAQLSVDVLRREFAHHLIRGSAWWWFDMRGGWYSGPEIAQEFRRQTEIAREATGWDLSSVSQVAGLVSAQSPAYHTMMRMFDVDPQPSLVELQADLSTREMYKAGAPIDWLMMEDLGTPAMQRYRVLYFHNATFMDDAQRLALEGLKGGGRTLIFVGYPGLVADGGLDEQAASKTVGMRLKLVHSRSAARFSPGNYDLPCMEDATSQAVFGSGAVISPRLVVDDAEAETIARWPDGAPAAAARRHDGWTGYYFPVPLNNAQIFRAIFRQAGCHVYTSGICRDVVYANASLLAVHTNHYFQPLTLPRPARVTELFSKTIVTDGGLQIPTGRPWHWTGGTNLYRVEYQTSRRRT